MAAHALSRMIIGEYHKSSDFDDGNSRSREKSHLSFREYKVLQNTRMSISFPIATLFIKQPKVENGPRSYNTNQMSLPPMDKTKLNATIILSHSYINMWIKFEVHQMDI